MKTYTLFLCLLFSPVFILAQELDFDPKTEIENGILGNYTLQDAFDWWDQNVEKNFFKDEVKLLPTESDILKAKSDIGKLDIDIADNAAVFYVCPENSDTIKLSGYLGYDTDNAGMDMVVPNETLVQIKTLPPTTLVFAIDNDNIVWYHLKYFNYQKSDGDDEYFKKFNNEKITTFTCNSGRYVYKYRPSKEDLRKYEELGREIYFISPKEAEKRLARLNGKITEEDIIVNVQGFPDESALIILDEMATIISRLNYYAEKEYREYLTPIKISVVYKNGRGGLSIEFPFNENFISPLPFIGEVRDAYGSWSTINMHLIDEYFTALALYKEKLMASLYWRSNESRKVADIISELPYYVILNNENIGEVIFTAYDKRSGGYAINKTATIVTKKQTYSIHSQNNDINSLYSFFILPEESSFDETVNTGVVLLKKFFEAPLILQKGKIKEIMEDGESVSIEDLVQIPDTIDKMPEFPGGEDKLWKYLSENLRYPVMAQEQGIQGQVIVGFVVQRDGSIFDIGIKKSLDPS